MEETKQTRVNENPDSLEIFTPSKGGSLKVYFDASKPEEAKARLKNGIELRKWMQDECNKVFSE